MTTVARKTALPEIIQDKFRHYIISLQLATGVEIGTIQILPRTCPTLPYNGNAFIAKPAS
jgi:hypothetical protein